MTSATGTCGAIGAPAGRRGLALVLGVAGSDRYPPDGCDDACHHNDSDFYAWK
jgi:hypothetical protein